MTELGELGLSSYEERIYRTLLVTGAVTATQLSDSSGVPKGRVYDVLNGLEARKLIRTRSGDPKQYAAIEPETAIDRLLAERLFELEEKWDRYREKAETVRSNCLPAPPTESSFWLGALGSDEMSTALQQHMRIAEKSVHAAIGPPYENATWETLQTEVESFFDGTSENITADFLISEKAVTALPETLPQLLNEQSVDVTIRTISDIPLSFDVVDQIVTTVDIPHPVVSDDRLGVLGIKDPRVVEEFERQFQQLWTHAAPLIE